MSNWIVWRGPAALFALAAVLAIASFISLMAAGDANEASDGQATVAALTRAAADIELAWYQAMGADALAATGERPAEARDFYNGAINLYNEAKAVLAAAEVEQIDQALAGSDAGIAGMTQAFEGTLQLAASGNIPAATQNHFDLTINQIYNNVDPAVEGLAMVAAAADAKLQSSLDSGASTLRWFSVFTLIIAAAGLAYAAYNGWTVYQSEAQSASSSEQAQARKAA
jgi:hypothetical protein